MTFEDAGFVINVPNRDTGVNTADVTIDALKKGATSATCVAAFPASTQPVKLYTTYGNPATGTQAATVSTGTVSTGAPGTVHNLTFNAAGRVTMALSYSDVGQLTLNAAGTALNGVAMTSTGGTFVVKPAGFVLSNIMPTNNPTWNDVGIITLTPSILSGNYLGVAGDTTVTVTGNVGRFYAAQFALSAASLVNRADIAGCAVPCGIFTYMGEQMNALFSLTAKAVDGTTTLQNYVDTFAKLNPTVAGALKLGAIDNLVAPATRTPLGARVSTTGLPAVTGQFLSTYTPTPACLGTAVVTAPFMITRGINADGPYAALDVGIAPLDSDGAIMAAYDLDTTNAVSTTNDHTKVARTEVRYGLMALSNAYGSELLPLSISAIVQYWDGNEYVTSATDSMTSFIASTNVQFINYQNHLTAVNGVGGPVAITFSSGVCNAVTGCFSLAAPGAGNDGSVDMQLSAPAYLLRNTARATFGIYKGNSHFIYFREIY